MSNSESDRALLSRQVRICVMLSLATIIGLLVGFSGVYMAVTKKPPVIASTENGRVIPVMPLNKAFVSDTRVLSFSIDCTRRAFSHDFMNFRYSMFEARNCFTSLGGDKFVKAMEPLLQDIIKQRMVMTATVEPPVIVSTYLRSGRYAWRVQTRIELYREGTKERMTAQAFVAELEVIQVDLEENVRGISISEFNVKPAST